MRFPDLEPTQVLLAPGQGNQRPGMGLELTKRSPAAMEVYQFADRELYPLIGRRNLTDIMWNGTPDQLKVTEIAQLAVVTDALARAAALKESNQLSKPLWYGGNSVGAIAAYVLSGAMEMKDAVILAHRRGEVFQFAIDNGPKTAMVALQNVNPQTRIAITKAQGLEVCLINSDWQWVVGGPVEQVDKAIADFAKAGFGADNIHRLQVDAAYHSKFLAPGLSMWRQVVEETTIEEPRNGLIMGGNSAMPLTTAEEAKQELEHQLTGTERLRDQIWALRARGVIEFTELNTASKLTRLTQENLAIFNQTRSQLVLPDSSNGRIIIAHHLTVPWYETKSRDDIGKWYKAWLADRQGIDEEEVTEDLHFVDGLGLESGDIMALRANVMREFGRVVPDNEAEMNVYVAQAIDATWRLANS